jgi:hypothetical protein
MRHIPWKTTVIVIALVLALALSLQAEASGKTPSAVVAEAQRIQRTMPGSTMSCTDGSCFVTSANGKTMTTVYMSGNRVYSWTQRKR